jgi:hypothetical protein
LIINALLADITLAPRQDLMGRLMPIEFADSQGPYFWCFVFCSPDENGEACGGNHHILHIDKVLDVALPIGAL